ncbi:hypothetical protein [Candidatus Poriferisodalis sp.]|uniref:hypothetical protein n=1 Tax=Candidatus Poriferisodalis sp. TaxID=3101277 RepID=UPI003D0B617F
MLNTVALAAAGASGALWVLWGRAPDRRRSAAATPRWPWGLALGSALAAGVIAGRTAGVVAGTVVAICSWCAAAVPTSRRRVHAAESAAQFAAILANQAQVSRTVVDALETAAPLATGPMARAAANLVSECRSVGVETAAGNFAATAETPAAEWLADVVAVAAASGGQWAPILGVLEAEAAETAATTRRFHRQVAANLPQLALATALGAAVVVGAAISNPDAWAWLTGPQGESVSIAAAVLALVICARPLSAAWEALR